MLYYDSSICKDKQILLKLTSDTLKKFPYYTILLDSYQLTCNLKVEKMRINIGLIRGNSNFFTHFAINYLQIGSNINIQKSQFSKTLFQPSCTKCRILHSKSAIFEFLL